MNAAELLPRVYDELRKLAAAKLASENPGHTLDSTALVHGAFLKLGGERSFADRMHLCSDLHATILHQVGLDRSKMEIPVLGRTMRLVEREKTTGPIRAILSGRYCPSAHAAPYWFRRS